MFLEGVHIDYLKELGHGAFGKVYEGNLKMGEQIAVKVRSENTAAATKLFENERKILASLGSHKNIVKYLGHCNDIHGSIALCFEWIDNGTLWSKLKNDKYDWCTWHDIILGICEGVKYLHTLHDPIIHMDIKLSNILVDNKKVPKLCDFGSARIFTGNQTQETIRFHGTEKYISPELSKHGIITEKNDIHCLGVLMLSILEGCEADREKFLEGPKKIIKKVFNYWIDYDESVFKSIFDLLNRCIRITVKCLNVRRFRRPNIQEVIDMLKNPKECIPRTLMEKMNLLKVDPDQFRVFFKPDKVLSGALRLTNISNKYNVLIRCRPNTPNTLFHRNGYFSAILPPKSACNYVVAMEKQKRQPKDMIGLSIILKSWVVEEKMDKVEQFSKISKEHRVTLKAVCDSEPIRPKIEIITVRRIGCEIMSMDVHPTYHWILTSHDNGTVSIWNYETQERVVELFISDDDRFDLTNSICSAKFIESMKWFVAGDDNGYIHVVNYETMREIEKIEAHQEGVESLAVHPDQSCMLSASKDTLIKLWVWHPHWSCIRTYIGHSKLVKHVMFNTDGNTFASASHDCKVKIWSTHDSRPAITTFDCGPDQQQHVAYFSNSGGQHIITGSLEGPAQVWDLQKKKSIKRFQGPAREVYGCNVGAVNWAPDSIKPVLITVSGQETISFRDATTYDIWSENYNFGLGPPKGFACIKVKEKRSLAIILSGGIAIMEMNEDEAETSKNTKPTRKRKARDEAETSKNTKPVRQARPRRTGGRQN